MSYIVEASIVPVLSKIWYKYKLKKLYYDIKVEHKEYDLQYINYIVREYDKFNN